MGRGFWPNEAKLMLSLPYGYRFSFAANSWVMNDRCAPSSKMIFPSIVTFGVLTIATAVLRRQELACDGEISSETDAAISPVV